MLRFILLPLLLIVFVGCGTPKPPLPTVAQVNLESYLGVWYEIARYEHRFEKGCSNVSATYSLKENGDIKVVNRCTKEGAVSEAVGVAHTTDATNSKLRVSFFRPFYGDYWIIMLDDMYRYAVVGDPSREYLWILSRTQVLDEAVKQEILQKLPQLGYDTTPLIWTSQKL